MTQETTLADPQRRDLALIACFAAASAVADPDLPASRKASMLMSCLGQLNAVRDSHSSLTMEQFRRGLRGAVDQLLPDDVADTSQALAGTPLLDENGLLGDDVDALLSEYWIPNVALEEHWNLPRVRAEQEEQRVYRQLRRLPAEDYSAARANLVELPAGELRTLRRGWDHLWTRFDVYTPIAAWSWCQISGHWFPCPICRWPMVVVGKGAIVDVRCKAHGRDGVSYTSDATTEGVPRARPAGPRAEEVEALPATAEYLAVTPTVWRYVTLPGVLECRLRDVALSYGASVEMWPHKDRYDLRIELGDCTWRVDAKAWASIVALGESLRPGGEDEADTSLTIVIPDYQRTERELLHNMISGYGYRVLTATGLERQIAKEARRQ
ncbi:restriction endonuclease-related protein [Streptomonospora wellingtoniae]|uniref:REase associating with pPIWI RE domain-containing protein n=1 Tax=Streptomonospora wellingtoniae TaxID=3075544 RepID=A0ABU2KMW3_9ACTN|nr:hypothetical protein [Streptomonospora sp. DSM 45055]MDT0300606.1 hypothetical protein [Streptomonospora sp. DSM 45055]